MTKVMVAVAITAFAVAGTSACATKGYVQTQVGQVNTKVDTLSQSLEETQQRTRANEERITAVDGKAGAAQTAADQAASGAAGANSAATKANAAAAEAAKKAETVESRVNRVIYEVVLSESQGNFAFGTAVLPIRRRPGSTSWWRRFARNRRVSTSRSKGTPTTWVRPKATRSSGWIAPKR